MTIGYSVALSIGSFTGAQSAIVTIDDGMSTLANVRANIASKMNRLDHTIANLENVVTNLSQSKGRIVDADFATETANLARTQVLQQAFNGDVVTSERIKTKHISLIPIRII